MFLTKKHFPLKLFVWSLKKIEFLGLASYDSQVIQLVIPPSIFWSRLAIFVSLSIIQFGCSRFSQNRQQIPTVTELSTSPRFLADPSPARSCLRKWKMFETSTSIKIKITGKMEDKKNWKLRICNWISIKCMCYHEKSGWFEDCYGEREAILNLQDQHFPKSTKSYQVFTIERGCSLSISTLIFWNQEGCYFGDVLVNHQRNTKKQAKKWWKIMHISCLQLDVLRCLCLGYQSPMEVCIRCIWQDRFTALLSAVYHHLWIARTAELLNMAATLMSRFHISTFTGWYPESTFEFTDVSHVRTSVEASGMLHTSVTESRSIFDQ